MKEHIRLAFRWLKSRGLRSYLTILGITIGIAAIVSLISLGEGLKQAINEQFEILGGNLVFVMPASIEVGLSDHDVSLIKGIRGVEKVAGLSSIIAKVKYKGKVSYLWVSGISEDAQDILLKGSGVRIEKGQEKFSKDDKYKVAIGYRLWNGDVFDRKVNLGDKIEIQGKKFEVVSLIGKIGNREDDSNVYIPLKAFKELFKIKDKYIMIIARIKDGYSTRKISEEIADVLRKDRNLEKGEEDFQVMSYEQIRESVNAILDAINVVVLGIAAISLFVGGVGIMNTMYTSVLERTREIGVMKAVGAKNRDVLMIFLIESGILGLIGGIVGVLIGSIASKLVEILAAMEAGSELIKAAIMPELILGSLLFSFIIGCISGLLPSYQASKLNPVDALRYE